MSDDKIKRGARRHYKTSDGIVLVKVLGAAKRAGEDFYRCEEMEGDLKGSRFTTHAHWLHPVAR